MILRRLRRRRACWRAIESRVAASADVSLSAALALKERLPSRQCSLIADAGAMGRVHLLILMCAAALLCLGPSWTHPPIRIFYNASPSIACGWYLVVPPYRLRVGMLVVAHIPSWAARLAAERDYLPITVPVIKRIAARDGESVCERSGRLAIDGRVVARALSADSAGRRLPAWQGCETLDRSEFLLLGDTWDSYDSRYFGPITGRGIIGRAIPLWTWQ